MAAIHTPKLRMYPIVYLEKAWNIFCRYFCSSWFEFCTELSLLNCRFRDMMMSRQCTNRIFLSGGSSFLHGLKSRVSSSRSRGTVRLNWCCVRANLWRTERLGVKATPSEVIHDCSLIWWDDSPPVMPLKTAGFSLLQQMIAVLQASDIFSSIRKWSKLQLVAMTGAMACVVLVVPSADAIDALKTCTCLLKECRWLFIILST